MAPSIEREMRNLLTERAEAEAPEAPAAEEAPAGAE